MTKTSKKIRIIYLIERPEIWADGKNRPVLWGCYKTKKSATLSAKFYDSRSLGDIKYRKQRVIKFKECV